VSVRDSVSFAGAHTCFNDSGELHAPERPRRAMKRMLGQLYWWARALRTARDAAPYADAANGALPPSREEVAA
jgi:hypothetical protein